MTTSHKGPPRLHILGGGLIKEGLTVGHFIEVGLIVLIWACLAFLHINTFSITNGHLPKTATYPLLSLLLLLRIYVELLTVRSTCLVCTCFQARFLAFLYVFWCFVGWQCQAGVIQHEHFAWFEVNCHNKLLKISKKGPGKSLNFYLIKCMNTLNIVKGHWTYSVLCIKTLVWFSVWFLFYCVTGISMLRQ